MSKIAVIKTGGKQYKVQKGDEIKVEKLKGEKGDKISFTEVLLVADGKSLEIGQPKLAKKVEAEILEQGRARKVKVVKYKPKVRYMKTQGHRQHFTKVKITAIA